MFCRVISDQVELFVCNDRSNGYPVGCPRAVVAVVDPGSYGDGHRADINCRGPSG